MAPIRRIRRLHMICPRRLVWMTRRSTFRAEYAVLSTQWSVLSTEYSTRQDWHAIREIHTALNAKDLQHEFSNALLPRGIGTGPDMSWSRAAGGGRRQRRAVRHL